MSRRYPISDNSMKSIGLFVSFLISIATIAIGSFLLTEEEKKEAFGMNNNKDVPAALIGLGVLGALIFLFNMFQDHIKAFLNRRF